MDNRVLPPATLYRGLLLFGAIVVPAFGIVFRSIAPHEVDPWSLRLAFSAMCVVLLASSRSEQRLAASVLLASFVVEAHMIVLATANGFSGDRVVAILVAFFCVMLSFRRAGETLAFGAFTAVLTAVGYRSAATPAVSQGVLQASLLTITAVLVVATESRRRMGVQLERSHRELEGRVEQRTRDLAVSMAQLEREIVVRKRAETEATAASVAKSAFLANMSHEFRTPLNAILGYTELLIEEAEALALGMFREDLGRVRGAASHLLSMIGHVLDLASIEAGRLRLHTEPVAVGPLLDSVCETARPLLDAGRNTLSQSCTDGLVANTDPDRLRQIVLNLLSNAAKFTDEGRVDVSAWSEGDRVFVSVSDTGMGIPDEVLPRLFEEFTQVDGTSTRRFGGTGLGLAISRRLARALGGDIGVRSTLGQGTTFTVTLPAGPAG